MGMLVEGQWQNVWYDTKSTAGISSAMPPLSQLDHAGWLCGSVRSRWFPGRTGRYTFMYHSPVPGAPHADFSNPEKL